MPADGYSMKLDASGWEDGLRALTGPVKESLARRMLVSGGTHMRDHAKMLAAKKSGLLAASIYLVFDAKASTKSNYVYGISWNASKAPHGHLIEFGHWRYNIFLNGRWQRSLLPGLTKGKGPQDHGGDGALKPPEWVRARPFLRPTLDTQRQATFNIMLQRGRKELPLLLAEIAK